MKDNINCWRQYADCRFGQVHMRCAQPRNHDLAQSTPLICLHQSPQSGAQYRLFQNVMAEDRLVICPDTPGFGSSDIPSSPPEIPDYAGAMADVLENLGYGTSGMGPVDVLGGHTGSVIGAELAASRPDLVRKIVFLSVALFTPEEQKFMLDKYGGPPKYFSDAEFVGNSYKQSVLENNSEVPQDRRFEMFTERLRSGMLAWYAPHAVMSYNAAKRLRDVAQPSLLLVVDDMLSENTRKAAKYLANARLREYTHINGHSGLDLKPNEIALAVREFLDADD